MITNKMYNTRTTAVLEYPTFDMVSSPFRLLNMILFAHSMYSMLGRAVRYGRMSIYAEEMGLTHLGNKHLSDGVLSYKLCRTACALSPLRRQPPRRRRE